MSVFFSLTHTLILHSVLIPCEPISEWPSVTIEYAKDPSSSFQASLSRIANAFHLLQTWHFQNVDHISLTASSRCKQIRTTACNPIIPNTVNYTSARENPSSGHCKWPLIAFTWQLSLPENVLGAASKLNHALSVPRATTRCSLKRMALCSANGPVLPNATAACVFSEVSMARCIWSR